jgi:hypothetical protein
MQLDISQLFHSGPPVLTRFLDAITTMAIGSYDYFELIACESGSGRRLYNDCNGTVAAVESDLCRIFYIPNFPLTVTPTLQLPLPHTRSSFGLTR